MHPWTLWPENPIFIELGVRDADLALSLREDDYARYLGVSGDAARIEQLQAAHPEIADRLTCSRRRKLALNNNADVLVLRGTHTRSLWRYSTVRHADWVVWPLALGLASLVGLIGCLLHLAIGRFTWPRIVTFRTPEGRTRRMFASRVRRPKNCRRNSLHFIPHSLGLRGMFRRFDERGVRYAVLRWFERLPEIEPTEDVDMLVADDSLADVLDILHGEPGIQPCDVYSESGLARSAYCGTPYYPPKIAQRILAGAVRHNDLCLVPSPRDHFHSLAYHAVYHKGPKSNLPRGELRLTERVKSEHDFAGILRDMAKRLWIDVEISLEGLHSYLQKTGWGPTPEILARLARAGTLNEWLKLLAARLAPHVHDQGLTVFVLREEAVRRGLTSRIVAMIREQGFEVLATRMLAREEIEYAAARTRGGNWEAGRPFSLSGGAPAAAVVAYDHAPIKPNRRQRRRFPKRTNARIFAKELIRDAIIAEQPPGEDFNALHSSDHAAEAWHLIEVLAPELVDTIRNRLAEIHGDGAIASQTALRQAA
jgi:nucleoside diphosphate kinase